MLKDRDFALRQKRAQFRHKRNASLTPLKVAIQEKRAFRLEKGFFDNNEEEFQDLKETILEHQIQVAEAERELNEIDLQLAQLDAEFRCLRKDYADFRDNFSASGFDPQVAQQRVPDLEKRAEDLGRILDDTEADREAFIITRERELGAGSLEAEIRSLKRQKRVADGRFKSRAALDERKVRHREMYLAGQRAGTEAIRRQEP